MEEAWVNDGFDKESFNPKTFFKLHDLNGDSEWDPFELEAVFEREVEALFEVCTRIRLKRICKHILWVLGKAFGIKGLPFESIAIIPELSNQI